MAETPTSPFLSKVNAAQRQALLHIYGPILVLAGPGTGKTHLLTTRILHLLSAGIGAEPENILCLTFTDAAAKEMKSRLIAQYGTKAYQIKVTTFHGFSHWLFEAFSAYFTEYTEGKTLADDLDKALIFEQVAKKKHWKYLVPHYDLFRYKNDILGLISQLKRENLTPARFRAHLPEERELLLSDPENYYKRDFKGFKKGDLKPSAEKKIALTIEKFEEFASFWEAYETALHEKFFDFDDIILWANAVLDASEDLRLELQERFQWILVDEYQDTNEAQNQILWHLTADQSDPNIFVVGDDNQSIYRFQGASEKNIKDFLARFPQAKRVTLEENYRSGQRIIDGAYSVISHNKSRLSTNKTLKAVKKEKGNCFFYACESEQEEISLLAQKIKALLEKGIPPQEIAILVRKNAQVYRLSQQLSFLGIPVTAPTENDLLQQEIIQLCVSFLKLFVDPSQSDALFDLLHHPYIPLSPRELFLFTQYFQEALYKKEVKTENFLTFLLQHPETPPAIQNIVDIFLLLRKDYYHCRPAILIEKFLYQTGIADKLTEESALQDWWYVRSFLDWIREKAFLDAKALLEALTLHQQLYIPLPPQPYPVRSDTIHIMTVHQSKGREFEVVFLPQLWEHLWDSPRKPSRVIPPPKLFKDASEHDIEEARRLFFVALTRAKERLYLSYAQYDQSGREKTPSRFLNEIDSAVLQEVPPPKMELPQLLPKGPSLEQLLALPDFSQRIEHFTWSATALQAYLDCPIKFLYRYIFRVPMPSKPHQALGIAVHQALEDFFQKQKQQKALLPKEVLLELFRFALKGKNVDKETFAQLEAKGVEVLTHYYEHHITQFDTYYPYGYELEFSFHKFNPHLEGIPITGQVDKVIFRNPEKSLVDIVDYKLSKPYASKLKEGTPFWRQLTFYALLVQQSALPWKINDIFIEFLEPAPQGTALRQRANITSEDLQQVAQELKAADVALKNREFPLKEIPENDEEIAYWQERFLAQKDKWESFLEGSK